LTGAAGNAIAQLSLPSVCVEVQGFFMINAVTRVGLVGRGARLVHAIVREQIAALLAPLYLVRRAGRDANSLS
jgi:hypothetical protein